MSEEIPMTIETMVLNGRERIVLDRQDYEDLIDARDHARAMVDVAVGGTLTDAEMDDYLASPTPLAFWRRRAGKTQVALAEDAGITQPFLAQMEAGRRTGTIGVLLKLAKALGVRVEDLVSE